MTSVAREAVARAKAILHYARYQPEAWRWLPRWLTTLGPGGSTLSAGLPWIPVPAIEWLDGWLQPHHVVFEYGSGGSTRFFRTRAGRVTSVEHDERWCARVFAHLDADGPSQDEHQLNWVPAPVRDGAPPPYDDQHFTSEVPIDADRDFKAYVQSIEAFGPEAFDLVFVDGRARPSCLRVARAAVRRGGYLMLDNADIGFFALLTIVECINNSKAWSNADRGEHSAAAPYK